MGPESNDCGLTIDGRQSISSLKTRKTLEAGRDRKDSPRHVLVVIIIIVVIVIVIIISSPPPIDQGSLCSPG